MKKYLHYIFALLLCLTSIINYSNAQVLFKDLETGPHPASSGPEQFINADGTMFIITRCYTTTSGALAKYQLWKSDGIANNTVLVKDSLSLTNQSGVVNIAAAVNGTLYFIIKPPANPYLIQLWKSDGTTNGTHMVDTLDYVAGSGEEPTQFIAFNNKLYFNFSKTHGRELWVSDGTALGTKEVINLDPGTLGSFQLGGLENKPMKVYNGKLYFSGATSNDNFELFSTDGTELGTQLVKELVIGSKKSSPGNWTVYKNELYFAAGNGSGTRLWKTDGSTTTQVSNDLDVGSICVFKNELLYQDGLALWKSDGAVQTKLKDSSINSGFIGATNDYLFFNYAKFIPVPPYYTYYYFRTDGTSNGTVPISYKVTTCVSYNVINNKMYVVKLDSGSVSQVGLWESDGTENGTQKIFNGYGTGNPFVYKNALFFTNYEAATGYELWTYAPGGANGLNQEINSNTVNVFPNPSNGLIKLKIEDEEIASQVLVYNLQGRLVSQFNQTNDISLLDLNKGIYLIQIKLTDKIITKKIVLQ